MQARSGFSASQQPTASGQPSASQAAQAQAAAQDQLDRSQSLNLALRQPPFRRKYTAASSIPATPIPKPLTSIEHFQPNAHPADPLRTLHQRRMMDAFIAHRRWGLCREIVEEARRKWNSLGNGSKKNSWYAIIEDEEDMNTCYTLQLLMQLPDCIIKSLIKNTLAYDYARDPEVKGFVNRHMKPYIRYAGIYVNIPTRSLPAGSLALSGTTGRGEFLSSDEVERLIKRVERYIANKPADYVENSNVDCYFKGAKSTPEPRRIFSPENPRWQEWLRELRSIYCKNVPLSERSTPFQRCPMEVGWSKDIPERLKSHMKNGGTTPIFGVVNVMTRQPTAQEGFGFPEPWQLALFPIWKRDIKLARVAEAVGSILCSSYWCYGGLNIQEAGYSNITSSTPDFDDILWEESIREAWKRVHEYGLADEEKQLWLDRHRMVETMQEKPQVQTAFIGARVEYTEASAERAEILTMHKRTKLENEELKREIQSKRRRIAYQRDEKFDRLDQLEDTYREWEELDEAKAQRDEDIYPFVDTRRGEEPSISESTLSEGNKTYLAGLDAEFQAEKEARRKRKQAEKAKQSSTITQDVRTQDGSQG